MEKYNTSEHRENYISILQIHSGLRNNKNPLTRISKHIYLPLRIAKKKKNSLAQLTLLFAQRAFRNIFRITRCSGATYMYIQREEKAFRPRSRQKLSLSRERERTASF